MKDHPKGQPSHGQIMAELKGHFAPVFESSRDGVYLWLDETHMVCNEKLAKMFGYTVEELCRRTPFLEHFVHEEDQELFSQNYNRSVAPLAYPVTFRFRARRKDGSYFQAETDMIPLSFHGHQIAYHFVRALA
jgi:PAS domain S-box-containing protein